MCPDGWHVPSDKEFLKLFDYVGGIGVAGKKLKSEREWGNGNESQNSVGFSVLPVGSLNVDGKEQRAYFWSSTSDDYVANAWLFQQSKDDVTHKEKPKFSGFSIRCLKDM